MSLVEPVAAPPVERTLAFDMIKRSLPALPVIVLLAGFGWGLQGAASAAFAIVLVLLNFLLSAAILATAARVSLIMLMAAALGGYIVRLALITIAVIAVHNQAWVSIVPLGFTIIVTHLGLLLWEMRYVSASLAFPDLKPHKPGKGR